MNYKTALIYFLILVAFISAILIGFMVIYSINPSLLGLSPTRNQHDLEKIQKEKKSLSTFEKYIISKNQFENLMNDLTSKDQNIDQKANEIIKYKNEIDSLQKMLLAKDSVNPNKQTLKDSLVQYRQTLERTYKDLSALKDSLNQDKQKLNDMQNQLKLKDDRIAQQEKFFNQKVDSLEMANFKQFATIYKNSQPAEIARILAQIDERDAAKILKLMPKKQAGKVIDAMSPQKAAMILLLGAGQ